MTTRPEASSLSEREQRVRNAIASGQLEGLNPSPVLRENLRRYVLGEVSVDELLREARLRHAAR